MKKACERSRRNPGHRSGRAAVAAVNEGQIFRFLTKPCPPEVLGTALRQAVEQHRLVTAERELLERTLKGSVQALLDVLGLANPVALGRAARARRLIGALAALIGFRDRWQMEMAAMLSQVGAIALPAATAERLAAGAGLSTVEEAQVADMPAVALRLLAEIPRLDEIRAILGHVHLRYDGPVDQVPRGDDIPLGARMLAVVLAYDRLTTAGHAAPEALARLQAHQGWYDPAILADLATVTGAEAGREILELRLPDVKLGMIFVDDVRTSDGTLLVARGQEVTPGLLGRVENYWSALELPAPVRVNLPEAPASRG